MSFNENFSQFLVNKTVADTESVLLSLEKSYEGRTPIPLYHELIKSGVNEREVFSYLAAYFKIPLHDFQLTEMNFELIDNFPREKLIEYQIVPYEEGPDYITFAISSPFKQEELQEICFGIEKEIRTFFVTPSMMDNLIRYMDNRIQQNTVISSFANTEKTEEEVEEDQLGLDAPAIKLCDSILKDAISRSASDIHIEPFEHIVYVRYRIDGKLTIANRVPTNLFQSLVARFKIMSDLNIAERRIPQDGKINLTISGVNYDFRVSTLPTIHGEKIVIRIYNTKLSTSELSALGFNKRQEALVKEMISKPHGIILLTGPTGSGKSTSLYAFLRYLNNEDTNIITVEDPVENQIQGINQIQVNPKANLTFAAALRSILRQDPNIIMIGEIRDEETAEIATRAAITGHLVLSTIHTNDAVGVVPRLINMGIPPYLVADSLISAISQRLVRKLCNACKKEDVTNEMEMKMFGLDKPHTIYRKCGCKVCNHTGYLGRVGVFEMMVCNDKIKKAIMSNEFTSDMLNNVVKDEMPTLLQNARERVLNGETSVEEYQSLVEVVKE